MQKQRRRYDRVSSCSTPSMRQSNLTLRSRSASRETLFQSNKESTAPSSHQQHASTKMNVPSCTRSNMLPGEGKTLEDGNLRRVRRTKQEIRNSKHAFKNTIVLAPFHALKQCFQNKLKDLYMKGTLDTSAKRVKIPNNSLFHYEVMEMKAGKLDMKNDEKPSSETKKENAEVNISKKRKSDALDESEYCQCFRSGRKHSDDSKRRDALGGLAKADLDGASTSLGTTSSKEMPSMEPPGKRMRLDDGQGDGESTGGKNYLISKKSSSQNRGIHSKKISNSKKLELNNECLLSQEPNDTFKKQRRGSAFEKKIEFKYMTRSVTRRETKQLEMEDHKLNQLNGSKANSPVVATQRNQEKLEKRNINQLVMNNVVEENDSDRMERAKTRSPELTPMRSDLSVLILGEIRAKAEKTGIPETGKQAPEDSMYSSDSQKPSKQRQQETAISEVTHMFDTLLKEAPKEMANPPEIDSAKKCSSSSINPESIKSDKNIQSIKSIQRLDNISKESIKETDHGSTVEPTIVVQEAAYESSSSDRVSINSKKPTEAALRSQNHAPLHVDEASTYIFGPRNSFQQIRESCEYGFGMSHVSTDDDDDCESEPQI